MPLNIKQLLRKEVLQFKPYIPGKPIAALKREMHIHNIYKLSHKFSHNFFLNKTKVFI